MTDEELDRLLALASACFRGPWVATSPWDVEPDDADDGAREVAQVTALGEQVVADCWSDGEIDTAGLGRFARPHSEFIAAARTAVPALVAEIKRLRGKRD